nr:hypothetical protein [Tanacetum cinerariifolium]
PASIVQVTKLRKTADIREGGHGVMPTQEDIKKIIEDASEDDYFMRGPWLSAVEYLNAERGITSGCFGDMKTFCKDEKLEQVVAVLSLVRRIRFVKLMKDENERYVDSILYKQIVETLMYLTSRRLDIMYDVNLICTLMKSPKEVHLQAAKKIMRYLQRTLVYGIIYKRGEDSKLIGFINSDYAGDLDDDKSIFGYAFMIGIEQ